MHENFNINMLNFQLNQFENKNQYQIQLSSDGLFPIHQIIKSMRIKITIENVYLTGVILIIGISNN